MAEADTSARDGSHDFDFLMGKWKIRHRRLTKPLSGSFAWYEFDGEGEAMRVWGGGDNIDEIWGDAPQGRIRGMTLRLYDRKSKQWRLYWANMATGVLETPVVGEFKDRKGEFYDQELYNGRAILVRYIWSDISRDSCRWEQAFSPDGGKTWETNWTMEFSRIK
ncbi:MAG: hypothetical protein ACLQEQ_04385 [Nitrososphaerales archaeon]